MTRRRFLAIFGGLLAAVTAAFPVLRRRSAPEVVFTMDVGATRMNDGIVEILHIREGEILDSVWYDETPPVWDGKITLDNDVIMNGQLVKSGIYHAACRTGKPAAARVEMESMFKGMLYHGNRIEL